MFTIIGGDGKEYGPATVDQIRVWLAAGRANLDTKAKAMGSEEWRRLGDFAEFTTSPASVPPVVVPTVVGDVELADRGLRLGAWFLDNVIAFLFCLPGLLLVGFSLMRDLLLQRGTLNADLGMRAVVGSLVLMAGGLALLIIQCWMLTVRGQTMGKRVLGVRVVRFSDHANPGFVSVVLLRWFVPGLITFLLNLLPPLGFIFFIVDSCFVFRGDRRCVHDLIAGTKVVKA